MWFAQCRMSWHGSGVYYRKDMSTFESGRELERQMWASRRRTSTFDTQREDTTECDEYGECKLDVFFTDHIVENSSVEDTMMVIQILDALSNRIKEQLPLIESITIVSDNAGCYKNNFFPTLSHVVLSGHGIQLSCVFRNVAQNTKTVLDGHLSVASRQVDKFIRETGCEVVVPSDLVHALTYQGGVKTTATDFISINRRSVLYQK